MGLRKWTEKGEIPGSRGPEGKKKQYLDRRLTTSMVGGRFTMETPGAVGGHSNGEPEVREVAGEK